MKETTMSVYVNPNSSEGTFIGEEKLMEEIKTRIQEGKDYIHIQRKKGMLSWDFIRQLQAMGIDVKRTWKASDLEPDADEDPQKDYYSYYLKIKGHGKYKAETKRFKLFITFSKR